MTRRTLVLWIALLALSPHAAQADAPAKHREFVWGATAFTGQDYNGVFSPVEVPTIYLLAGQTHMLTPRQTLVYYWPIDREYKPDWASLNEEVGGTVEILDHYERIIQRITRQPYIIQSPDMQPDPAARLLVGDAATSLYQAYVAEREAYFKQVAAYDSQLQQALQGGKATQADATAKLGQRPPAFTKYLAAPNQGFALKLAPGVYGMRLRDGAGQIVRDSQRTLISIAPRRTSISYAVIPESKWTVPEASDEASQVIYYSAHGATLYLDPAISQEYNQRDYAGLQHPQDTTTSASRWMWVRGPRVDAVHIEIWAHGQRVGQAERRAYSVTQLPGAALGYKVVPYDMAVSPQVDLEAFEVPALAGVSPYTLRLVRADGTVVPGGERTLVRAGDGVPAQAYGLLVLPLMVGLTLHIRRRRVRRRSLAELAAAGI